MSGGGSLTQDQVSIGFCNLGKRYYQKCNQTIGLVKRPTSFLDISEVVVAKGLRYSYFLICLRRRNNRTIHKTHTFYYKIIENACLLCNTNTIVMMMNQICIIFAIVIVLFTNSITAWTPIVTSFQRIHTTSLLSKAGSVSKYYITCIFISCHEF